MRRLSVPLKWLGLMFAAVLVAVSVLTPVSPALAAANAPGLTDVQPEQAANDVDTPIQITGSDFSNAGGVPQVFLGTVALAEVEWVNATTLTAVVPWGLQAGVYSLRVVNPDESEATLESAFEVLDGVGEWNTSAIDGGPVQTVIPVDAVPGLLYAYSGVTSAIYRSDDYGDSWVTAGHGGGQYLVADPTDGDTIYLDANQSTDGGATWRQMLENYVWPGDDQSTANHTRVFIDPADSNTLFLAMAAIPEGGGNTGLLVSSDRGQTWQTAQTGLLAGDTNVTAIEFFGSKIYLGTRDGNLYQSDNGGATWARIGSAPVLPSIGVLEVNPYDTDELWVSTHFEATANAKMIKIDLSDPAYAVTQLPGWPDDQYPRNMGFLSDDTVFTGTRWDHGWISENDGGDWALFEPSSGKPGNCLALDPWDGDLDTFYIADEQYGVQKTTDRGLNWTQINTGLHAMSPNYLEIDPANPSRVYSKIAENGWPGIHVSADGGQSWVFSSLETAGGGASPTTSMLAVNGDRVFAGAHGNDVVGYGPQLFISDDHGATWVRLDVDPTPTPAYADSFHMPWTLKVDPQNPGTLLMIAIIGNRDLVPAEYVSEIYRSTDNGDTWQQVNLAAQVGREVHNLAYLGFDPSDSDVVYAAGDYDILKSTDNGLTWTFALESETPLGGPIAVEPVAPFRVYVGGLVSSDEGATWGDAHLPIAPAQMIFVGGSDTLYIAGEGLYSSSDGGTTWSAAEGALASAKINAMALTRVDQRTIIYVGTPGGETPGADLAPGRFSMANSSSLEAGVYRMTKAWQSFFLPLVRK